MIKKIIGRIWSKTPRRVRLRIIRTSQNKFTASVAAIVVNDERKVLLLDHVLRPISNWGLPGGFIDAAEQPETAINRELFEETGLELTELKLYRVRTLGRHIEILFTARSNGEAKVKSREINDLGWFGIAEMPNEMSEAQKQIVVDVLDEFS